MPRRPQTRTEEGIFTVFFVRDVVVYEEICGFAGQDGGGFVLVPGFVVGFVGVGDVFVVAVEGDHE